VSPQLNIIPVHRKNWIHIGSEEAGPCVAAIVSIVETCRRLTIPVRDYLGSVLPGLATFPINRIVELTPVTWAGPADCLISRPPPGTCLLRPIRSSCGAVELIKLLSARFAEYLHRILDL
jgi:hypothetical protein